MKPEYITRKNNDFKIIQNSKKRKTLTILLKQEYPYILQSMKYEEYKIEYNKFDLIQELVYENKVVGILSIENIDHLTNSLSINEVYILPEFRHNGIFYQTLTSILYQANINIKLRNPNRHLLDLLIKYNYAKKLKNNIIISYIDILIDDNRLYTNKQLREYTKNIIKNELITTNFYDSNINSSIFMEISDLNDFYKNKIFIIKARLTDSKQEKYYKLLKNVDNIYLENLKKRIITEYDEFINFFENTEEIINEQFNINKILGTDTTLTPAFIEQLNNHNLNIKDGFIIRKKVKKALENNEIISKTIIIRTLYLLENYNRHDIEKNQRKIFEIGKCPHCSKIRNQKHNTCLNCGFNFNNNEYLEKMMEIFYEKLLLNEESNKFTLKEELNFNQNTITDKLKEELSYMEYEEQTVYNMQSIVATYQFLKNIDNLIYFEVFNYDVLNNIREGSAFEFAKSNNLIKDLNDYGNYIRILKEISSKDKLEMILKEYNIEYDEEDDLIEILFSNMNPRDIFGKKYELTKRGKDFLNDNDFIDNYLENLFEFSFYEYLLFYQRNNFEGLKEFNENFSYFMNDIAVKTGNYYKYHNSIRYMLNTSDLSQRESLILFIKLFIVDVNYWICSRKHRKNNKPLSNIVIEAMDLIKDLCSDEDIEKIFDKAFNNIEINFLSDNYKFVKFYFFKSLEYDNMDDINMEIEYNIFKDEYMLQYSNYYI